MNGKFDSSRDEVTTVRPSSTHPMDNPLWKAPLGPLAERKEKFWIDNGQNQLKQRLEMSQNKNIAKNIIIFIGDGMSLATQMATRAYLGNENIYLSFEKFPYTGLSRVSNFCRGFHKIPTTILKHYLSRHTLPIIKYQIRPTLRQLY